jgi:uncharacterized protein YeaO (DUF488 family)
MAAKRKLDVRLKRAYELPSPTDGTRVLVDRLWPRGISKRDLAITDWLKEVAPSNELRQWFGHVPERWEGFRRRYKNELAHRAVGLNALRKRAQDGTLTLVYAARDEAHNEAVVLRDMLMRSASSPAARPQPRRRPRATQKKKARSR